jgi:glycosyltransferase involved in cell wall biosynthesis
MKVYFMGPSRSDHFWLEPLDNGITLVHSPSTPRGLRWTPITFREWLESRRMAQLAMLCEGPFDVLWNFDLFRFQCLRDRRHARVRVLHVMDLPSGTSLFDIAERSDAIILVSQTMARHLPVGAVEPIIVPHGYSPSPVHHVTLPDTHNGIRVGYMGNMAIPCLDRPSLLRLVRANRHITLYLIGPDGGNLSKEYEGDFWRELIAEPNVSWIGAVPSEQVGGWLRAMDLLLIAYDTVRYVNETAHPHKLLEYLASGRPILATYMRDMVHLTHLIEMLPPGAGVDRYFSETLARLEELSAPDLVDARIAYALEHTYTQHTARILDHLNRSQLNP